MPKPPAIFAPTWLDRVISYVAPTWGAHRMQSRMAIAVTQSVASGMVPGVRRLSSSREGTLGNWSPRREERLAEARSIDTIMARAESLAANDGNATSAIDSLALNVAGPGLRPQSYPDAAALGISEEEAQAFADSAEAAWAIWCKEAHAGETMGFEDLQYQAVRSMFITGEFLQLPVWLDGPERTFGLALQDLHPARLRTPSDLQGRAEVSNGVHLGQYNRPIGYFIACPPANTPLAGLSSANFIYVPRKIGHRYACLHRFHSGMPEQTRGTSILSPAMKMFRDLSDYVDYELVGALIAASFTVFLEAMPEALGGGSTNLDGSASTSVGQYPIQMQPGTLITGQPGHKPHILSSNRPGPQFDPFYERILRVAAASTGQPYEMVAKDFSKTNYSSARAALLEVWKMHTLYQDWLVRGYLNILWGMVMEEAWIRGLLVVPDGAPSLYESPLIAQAWLSNVWTRPPRGQIDPTKEREAEQLGLDALTETRTSICHARGLDWETVAKTRARENHLMDKLGIAPAPAKPKPKQEPKSDQDGDEAEESGSESDNGEREE